jgi:hypothetical protein
VPWHFWIAMSDDSLCVGLGDRVLNATAIWFDKPVEDHPLPHQAIYRVATPVHPQSGGNNTTSDTGNAVEGKAKGRTSTPAAETPPDVQVTLNARETFVRALATSKRRREDAVKVISSLEYHMHKQKGFLRVLRGESYVLVNTYHSYVWFPRTTTRGCGAQATCWLLLPCGPRVPTAGRILASLHALGQLHLHC